MPSPHEIRAWLEKLGYPGEIPSDDILQDFSRGPIGPVFRQLIDKVKPRSTVDQMRKNIIINQLKEKNPMPDKLDDKVHLYKRKQELQKQLRKLEKERKIQEENLKLLKAKIMEKNAKEKLLKDKIMQNDKDETVYRAKQAELEKILKNAQKLKEEMVNLLNALRNKNKTEIENKIKKTTNILSDHTEKIDLQEYVKQPHEKNISNSSISWLDRPLNPNCGTVKKNLSTAKKVPKSTSKHFVSVTKSSISKRPISKRSPFPSNTTLGSTNRFVVNWDNSEEVNRAFHQSFVNNLELQKCVDDLWNSDRKTVFSMLTDMQEQETAYLQQLIVEDISVEEDIEDIKMDRLYAFHVQNLIRAKICEKNRREVLESMKELEDNVDDITKYTALKDGLIVSKNYLKQKIEELKHKTGKDDDFSQIVNEAGKLSEEMINMKRKTENKLCLIYDCNSWTEKARRGVQNVFFKALPPVKEKVFEENLLLRSTDKFGNLSFDFNRQYSDGWSEVYSNPELLTLIKKPHLSQEKIFEEILAEKNYLEKLKTCLKSTVCDVDFSKILSVELKDINECAKSSKLTELTEVCKKNSYNMDNLIESFKFQLTCPFNKFVVPKRLFDGKPFTEYMEEIDELHRKSKEI